MFLSSAIITVHLENLRHNLKTLLARHPSLMPVIKARRPPTCATWRSASGVRAA